MTTPEPRCPDCHQALTPRRVVAPSGADVDVRECARCGRLWAPEGRLQRVWGAPARHRLVGGETRRSCVECRILLTPARLPSGAAVEVCSACHGMLLEPEALASLGLKRAAVPAPRPPPPPAPVERVVEDEDEEDDDEDEDEDDEASAPPPGTFECVLCSEYKPLREGQALLDGLACRTCMKERARGR